MINKRSLVRALRPLFYVCLDVSAGTAIYVVSVGEVGLTPGQLAIRILTGMALASAIVGGPDIMLYWQESGRRIEAEEERDAALKNRDDALKNQDAAAARADAAEQDRDSLREEVRELRATVEQLQNERGARRSRRRRLRSNGQ